MIVGISMPVWETGYVGVAFGPRERLDYEVQPIMKACGVHTLDLGQLARYKWSCVSALAVKLPGYAMLVDPYGIANSLAPKHGVPRPTLLGAIWDVVGELICEEHRGMAGVELDDEVPRDAIKCAAPIPCGNACEASKFFASAASIGVGDVEIRDVRDRVMREVLGRLGLR